MESLFCLSRTVATLAQLHAAGRTQSTLACSTRHCHRDDMESPCSAFSTAERIRSFPRSFESGRSEGVQSRKRFDYRVADRRQWSTITVWWGNCTLCSGRQGRADSQVVEPGGSGGTIRAFVGSYWLQEV